MYKIKFIYLLSLFLFVSCKTSSQTDININNLEESFINKDESQFLNQFPKEFKQFNEYFGWDIEKDEPSELYKESNNYIDYWFNLLNKNEKYENNIISICYNGKWYADAVNYFQYKSLRYIKEKNKYYLINELDDMKAKSVLFFLFDSPYPKKDNVFNSNLNSSKRKIIDDLFNAVFSVKDKDIVNTKNISFYENNDDYFVKEIDINNDNVLDKIVSSKPYQGDDLFLFVNNNNKYVLRLKTINFSEDGGNQITDIKKNKNGFVIKTKFPDRGYLESEYYIEYKNNDWYLINTIYKTESSNQEDSFIYVCNVKQELNINDIDLFDKVKSLPDETNRNKTCIKELMNTKSKPELKYKIKDPDGYTNLRKEENSKSEILQKIISGETIQVLYDKGNWWLVQTKEGKRGYVYKTKIVSE
ncbi:SH3 domain-containing protein [Flavobacterium gelidilacus]|uniref:SH3 domain-containing protein n=1 Tax=Flavobacterium gelidilacus TaxID=206041 RepID=UPI000686A203|nr:SH3 domain-containing protein [Flavobacterium gelidilacus]